jgi:hypothetical protein
MATQDYSAAPSVVPASDESRAVGWRFFLWWMLAFLGFPMGGCWRSCWWVRWTGHYPVRLAEPWRAR